MSELLTVADFAKRAGVTPQAVYKRLSTDLRPYVKTVDNRKMLDSSAIQLFAVNQVDQPENNQVDTLQALVSILQEQMETLREQLTVKDLQIQEQARQISDLSERLREGHALLDQQQRLHAAQLLAAPEEPEPDDSSPTEDLTGKTPPRTTEPEPERKSWLRRIFTR